MKIPKGMEIGRRGKKNRKWQALEQKGKMDVKTLVEVIDRRKKWEDTSITAGKE